VIVPVKPGTFDHKSSSRDGRWYKHVSIFPLKEKGPFEAQLPKINCVLCCSWDGGQAEEKKHATSDLAHIVLPMLANEKSAVADFHKMRDQPTASAEGPNCVR